MKFYPKVLFVMFVAFFASLNIVSAQTSPAPKTAMEKAAVSDVRLNLESQNVAAAAPVVKDLTPKKVRRQLPMYFSRVVSPDQRAEIYAIQERYLPLINMLSARVDALRDEMNGKVHAVLSQEQLKEVEQSHEEARRRRQSTSAARGTARPSVLRSMPATLPQSDDEEN